MMICRECETPLVYTTKGYFCPNCGIIRTEPDFPPSKIECSKCKTDLHDLSLWVVEGEEGPETLCEYCYAERERALAVVQ